MDTYLMMARIVYALDLMVWLLPKLAVAAAAGLAAWGFAKLTIFAIRRWNHGQGIYKR